MAKNCGSCTYGVKQRDGSVECHGNPPVPALVGARPGRFGSVEMQVEMLRPRMPPATPPCHLYLTAVALPTDADIASLAKG